MLQLSQLELLHRHGFEWLPLEPVDNREHLDPVDHDVEREVLRGARLFRCEECELEIMAVPPEG